MTVGRAIFSGMGIVDDPDVDDYYMKAWGFPITYSPDKNHPQSPPSIVYPFLIFPCLVHSGFPSGLSILPYCASIHLFILLCCPSVHLSTLSWCPSTHQSSSHHPSFPHFSPPLFPHQIFIPVFLKPSPSLKKKKGSYWWNFYENLLREIPGEKMQKGSIVHSCNHVGRIDSRLIPHCCHNSRKKIDYRSHNSGSHDCWLWMGSGGCSKVAHRWWGNIGTDHMHHDWVFQQCWYGMMVHWMHHPGDNSNAIVIILDVPVCGHWYVHDAYKFWIKPNKTP